MITSTSSSQVKQSFPCKKGENQKRNEAVCGRRHENGVGSTTGQTGESLFFGKLCSGKCIVFKQICKRTDRTCQRHRFRANVRYQDTAGALAIVKMAQYTVQDMMKDKPLLLLVENLQDPGNLGTIVRMAEGAGVTGVILSPEHRGYLQSKDYPLHNGFCL